MHHFPLTKIEDCCDILDHLRRPVSEEERSRRVGSIPYYGANGINGFIDGYLFNEPLILIAEDGGHFEEYETRPIAYSIQGKSWVNNHAHVLRAKEGFVQEYIFYCLEHKNVTSFIKGGTRVKFNQSELRQITIPIPSLVEQSKIAQILHTIDQVIEKTLRLIDKYQVIREGLIEDLLTRGVNQLGQLRPSYQESSQSYKKSALGWIPIDWTIKPLKHMAEVHRGRFSGRPRYDPKYYGGAYPFIQAGEITNATGQYLREYRQTLNDQGAKMSRSFPRGTILVTLSGNIADTAILDVPMYVPDSIAGVILHPNHSIRFVELAIRRNKGVLDALAPQSAQKNINLEDLKPLSIPLPDLSEQIRIAEIYESIESMITIEKQYVDKLRQIKSSLREDLLSGKVRVVLEPPPSILEFDAIRSSELSADIA